MKERPILFSAPMVRALLAGTKTQTRRVVKPCKDKLTGCQLAPHEIAGEINAGNYTNVKYGTPGDRLWVRESFQALFADGIEDHYQADYKTGKGYDVFYMATDERHEFVNADDDLSDAITPSIFMPRWASRITLEITRVRVERVQEISREDEIAEGTPDGMFYDALWSSINGGASWAANPWVWVIEFRNMPNVLVNGGPARWLTKRWRWRPVRSTYS